MTVIRGPAALEKLARVCVDEVVQSRYPVFLTHAWVDAWFRYLAPMADPILVSDDRAERVIAIFAEFSRFGSHSVIPAGVGVSDYPPIRVTCEEEASYLHAALAGLADRGRSIRLYSDDGQTWLQEVRAKWRGISLARDYELAPLIRIDGCWEDYLRRRTKRLRANLKRAERRVRGYGRISVTRERMTAGLLCELEEVERASWKWDRGTAFLASTPRRRFLEAATAALGNRAEVWLLRANRLLIAFAVTLLEDSRRIYYLPSFRASHPDSGTYLLREIIRASFDENLGEFDFGQGDERYKSPWQTSARRIRQLALFPRGAGGWARALLTASRWQLAKYPMARAVRYRGKSVVRSARSRLNYVRMVLTPRTRTG